MDKFREAGDGLFLPLLLWILLAVILLVRPPMLNFAAYRLGIGEEQGAKAASGDPAATPAHAPVVPAVLSQRWPQPPARAQALLDLEGRIAAATQEQRKLFSKLPLEADPQLAAAAATHSARMAAGNFLGSTSPEGDGAADRFGKAHRTAFGFVSENVQVRNGPADAPALAGEFVSAWLNSPEPRRNLLDPEANRLGTGCAEGKRGDAAAIYCTQLFLRAVAWTDSRLPEEVRDGQSLRVRLTSASGLLPVRGLRQVAFGSGVPASRADLAGSGAAGTLTVRGPAGLYRLEAELPADEPGRFRLIPGPYLVVTAP